MVASCSRPASVVMVPDMARPEPTPEQIERLPKWAQRERQALLYDNATLRKRVEELPDGPENLIYADPFAASVTEGDKPRPVGTVDTTILYHLTPDKDRQETLTAKVGKSGELLIAASYKGLRIEPRASNLVIVRLGR